MKTMKFENLKLPVLMKSPGHIFWDQDHIDVAQKYMMEGCRAIFDQMKAHYEGKEQPTPEWRLPDPPPGQQWHRDDWTQDMLPEGYRPLLLGEDMQMGDERYLHGKWEAKTTNCDWVFENADEYHVPGRTCRPLPAPVEYVPLGPEDVPPGSAVRKIGEQTWQQVMHVGENHLLTCLFSLTFDKIVDQYEILRPGSSTWEPCKKVKQPFLDTKAG